VQIHVHELRTTIVRFSTEAKPVFATREQALVIKTLGQLSPRDQQLLKEAMTKIVG